MLNLKTTITKTKTGTSSNMWGHSPQDSLYYSVIEGFTFQKAHVASFCQSKQCEMEFLNYKLTC